MTKKGVKRMRETLKKQYDYQNEYNKKNYDRVSLMLPKGTKEKIKSLSRLPVNTFINDLVKKELERLEQDQR